MPENTVLHCSVKSSLFCSSAKTSTIFCLSNNLQTSLIGLSLNRPHIFSNRFGMLTFFPNVMFNSRHRYLSCWCPSCSKKSFIGWENRICLLSLCKLVFVVSPPLLYAIPTNRNCSITSWVDKFSKVSTGPSEKKNHRGLKWEKSKRVIWIFVTNST